MEKKSHIGIPIVAIIVVIMIIGVVISAPRPILELDEENHIQSLVHNPEFPEKAELEKVEFSPEEEQEVLALIAEYQEQLEFKKDDDAQPVSAMEIVVDCGGETKTLVMGEKNTSTGEKQRKLVDGDSLRKDIERKLKLTITDSVNQSWFIK